MHQCGAKLSWILVTSRNFYRTRSKVFTPRFEEEPLANRIEKGRDYLNANSAVSPTTCFLKMQCLNSVTCLVLLSLYPFFICDRQSLVWGLVCLFGGFGWVFFWFGFLVHPCAMFLQKGWGNLRCGGRQAPPVQAMGGSSKLQHKELRTCCTGKTRECWEQQVQTVRPWSQRNKTSEEWARTEKMFAISQQVTVLPEIKDLLWRSGQYEVRCLEMLHISFPLLGIFSI